MKQLMDEKKDLNKKGVNTAELKQEREDDYKARVEALKAEQI